MPMRLTRLSLTRLRDECRQATGAGDFEFLVESDRGPKRAAPQARQSREAGLPSLHEIATHFPKHEFTLNDRVLTKDFVLFGV